MRLDGKTGYAVSAPLPRELKAKTIEVWVRLDNLEQRGGGAISIQTLDGGLFDAIVFGEQEAGIWMAGSEFFRRYQSVGGTTGKGRGESRGSRGDHLCRRRHDSRFPRWPAATVRLTSRPAR